jgi:hypothetical protein
MKSVGFILAAALAFGSGCAQTDWIDRTLVTVDVTGTWYGSATAGAMSSPPPSAFLFELEQQGSSVKGFLRLKFSGTIGDLSGPIEGTVSGDVFRFRNTRGSVEGELTVGGDEMTGQVTWPVASSRQITLRRVDSSSRPDSPRR